MFDTRNNKKYYDDVVYYTLDLKFIFSVGLFHRINKLLIILFVVKCLLLISRLNCLIKQTRAHSR